MERCPYRCSNLGGGSNLTPFYDGTDGEHPATILVNGTTKIKFDTSLSYQEVVNLLAPYLPQSFPRPEDQGVWLLEAIWGSEEYGSGIISLDRTYDDQDLYYIRVNGEAVVWVSKKVQDWGIETPGWFIGEHGLDENGEYLIPDTDEWGQVTSVESGLSGVLFGKA